MKLRHHIALSLIDSSLTLEGILIMTIISRLDALEASVTALQQTPAIDASQFATEASVSAVAADIQAIKDEIGTEPTPESPADPSAETTS